MFLSDPTVTAFPWLGPKKGKLFFKKEEAAIHIGLLNHHYAVQLTKSHEQQGNTKELLLERNISCSSWSPWAWCPGPPWQWPCSCRSPQRAPSSSQGGPVSRISSEAVDLSQHCWHDLIIWNCFFILAEWTKFKVTLTLGGSKNTNFQNSMGALSSPISFALRISKQFLFLF